MITTLDKKNLRQIALKKRIEMDSRAIKESSTVILHKILNSIEFKNAKNIAIYYPIKNEIDLTALLNIQDKNFYLPRCNGDNLEFVKYLNEKHLKIGSFGIIEAYGEKINPEILDLIYIPAVMANKKGYRLGYGKGFYDKFFRKNKINAKKIVVVDSIFISNDFIQDEYDVKLDMILSNG